MLSDFAPDLKSTKHYDIIFNLSRKFTHFSYNKAEGEKGAQHQAPMCISWRMRCLSQPDITLAWIAQL